MRRILLSCALLTVLSVSAVAVSRASTTARSGYLVVRKARNDGGVNGKPVVTVVVHGFVLGRISQEAAVEMYHLAPASGTGAPQVRGTDVFTSSVRWHGLSGKRYSSSSFRFRAPGGYYRIVVRGSGVYIYAGGRGTVWVQGSSANRRTDGEYSVNGGTFRSLPTNRVKRTIGQG
ncbi:MAG TPA: hypothetical protein VJV76_04595 [Gaiellaceae bacterium]|nr:hypothetical protein [Gaiellaceae bacterium]